MYGSAAAGGAGATGAMLPVTGFNVVWFVVAGFTLVAAGLALWRMVPRKEG